MWRKVHGKNALSRRYGRQPRGFCLDAAVQCSINLFRVSIDPDRTGRIVSLRIAHRRQLHACRVLQTV
jgi:hypothetical protein